MRTDMKNRDASFQASGVTRDNTSESGFYLNYIAYFLSRRLMYLGNDVQCLLNPLKKSQ